MSPSQPHIISGTVVDSDSNPLENIDVFVLDKNLEEIHHSTDAGFGDLLTDASGEFQTNLASFTANYSDGDIVFVTARNGNDTAIGRLVVTQIDGGNNINITMETLDPVMNIVHFLRIWLDDTNLTRANTATMIMPNAPRSQKLKKSSYPRISVVLDNEESEKAGITSTTAEKITSTIKIGTHVWAKEGAAQVQEIDSDNYEGQRLREYLQRQISDILRQRFLLHPAFDKDPHIQNFYAYQRNSMEEEEFNEEEGLMHGEIEIQFQYYRQN